MEGMVVTIELETVREPDYSVGKTKNGGGKRDKKDGSRERDESEIEMEMEESGDRDRDRDRKARDLEEADGEMLGSPPRTAVTVDGRTPTSAVGDINSPLGRTGSGGEVHVERTGTGTEGRSRQRRSWDVGAALRRRQRELVRMEEEDAFKTQL